MRFNVNGAADFGKKVTCTISRNGDLVHRVYLRVELPDVKVKPSACFRWLNWVGHILIKSVEVEIGGQRIKLVSPEKYHALVVYNSAAQEEKHLVVRTRRSPTKRPTRREGKATGTSGCVRYERACDVFKLFGKAVRAVWYQAAIERSRWPRVELGYGNNPSDLVTRSQAPVGFVT